MACHMRPCPALVAPGVILVSSGDGPHLEIFKCMIAVLGRIDSENHALGTMRRRDFLTAIEPERVRGIRNEQ